ncbi:hypothetical protein BHE74_00052446 [Ensete ventricosum]|nr:hypothetical protein BHE74_00052446 [Ensete ventricosum]
MGNQASHLEAKIENLKSEGDPKQLVAAHQRVAELQADNAKKMFELGEVTRQLDQANRELNEARAELADNHRHIKEQKVSRRKADDDLLKMMKENETLKSKLSCKSITDYKQLVDSNPFTKKPEDNTVPMETRQEFDDSVPAEE